MPVLIWLLEVFFCFLVEIIFHSIFAACWWAAKKLVFTVRGAARRLA